jgi:prepilin signal peptidase PulO-like enzyme (type II secretory pathway)
MHRRLALTCINQFELLMRARWKLIEEAHSSISMPFYIVLAFWLVIIFASFGLTAPRNMLSYVTILLGALSIASVVFVILDLDTPFSGIFMVSSQPLRDALAQFNR